MTMSELTAAVQRLFHAKGTEKELDNLLNQLVVAFPHAQISDLIYYPKTRMSAEDVANEAFKRENAWAMQQANES